MDEGKITTSIDDNGIARLSFYHPRSNSLPSGLLNQLANSISELGREDRANVILIRSEGNGAFCAGASFDELQTISDERKGLDFFMGFARVILAIRNCRQFVVSRVHGKTVGGGVGLVAASDYSFAMNTSAFRLSELAVGIGPFVVGPAVERKIGTSAFSAMSIDADWRDADFGARCGLYTRLFSTIAELDEALEAFALKLAKSSPHAMARLKEVLWQGTSDWEELLPARAAISGSLVITDYAQNAIRAAGR